MMTSGVTRGAKGAPMATFHFFFIKKMDGPYRRTQGGGGHSAIAPPLVLALLWIPIRVVKISDTGVSFFDKKTLLKWVFFL